MPRQHFWEAFRVGFSDNFLFFLGALGEIQATKVTYSDIKCTAR
jgi:hypothetical protein